MPIFGVEVIGRDQIEVLCGAHYGAAAAVGSARFKVVRAGGQWRMSSVSLQKPTSHVEAPEGFGEEIEGPPR